nr:apurinic-apyrimidinic endonuclease-like [Lytechinus pictus]
MSSSAPTTRMRLRRKCEAGSSGIQDPPAETSGSSGTSSRNESKRAPSRRGKQAAVETKTTMTTRRRGKKAIAEDIDAAEGKNEASSSKAKGEKKGRKRGGARVVEDLQNAKPDLMTEEPMDTRSDPSSDEFQANAELLPPEAKMDSQGKRQGKGQGGKTSASESSISHETDPKEKVSTRAGRSKVALKVAKVDPEPFLEERDTARDKLPVKRQRRTKATVTDVKEEKDQESNDAESKVEVTAKNGQQKKSTKGKGKKATSKSKSASLDDNDVKTESLVEHSKIVAVADNGVLTTYEKCVGAHCSIAGGLWKAVNDAVSIGAKSFALFLRSQRQWQAKPLEDDNAAKFREACTKHGYPPHLILPHGSYLLNCGSPNPATLSKSRDSLVDELTRCQKLGLTLYNFHPGSTCGDISIEECLDKIGESINLALDKTSGVTAVIENMSRQGHTIGGQFEELRGIIDRVKDKSRIGVCLDTCHAFAAGYELSTESGFKKMMADFEKIIGFQYLKGVHLNDSKGEVGCHLDRHENIGKGNIGLEGFKRVMNDPRFNNIPLILETPIEYGYAEEIKTLYSLVD